ncbi:MAG: polyketide cyclase [Bacteroidia bacterium]|nr:polyketide cyclase [Bacteroidia bacterium]
MSGVKYHFITHWEVEASKAEVADILNRPMDLPLWWPSVYLGIEKEITPEGKTYYHLFTKGWLPYTLRWKFRQTVNQLPDYLELEAEGDFNGYGKWSLRQEGSTAKITYDWEIVADKLIFRLFSFALRPLFSFNHHWAMKKGLESLRLEIARIRENKSREQTPIPPLATFPHGFYYRKNRKAAQTPVSETA